MAAPSAFKFTFVVVDENALGVDDVNLFGIFIEVEEKYAGGKYVGILIILLYGLRRFPGLGTRSAMAELPEQLAIAGEFHDGIAAGAAGDPDISFPIHEDAVFGAGSRTRITFRRPSGHADRAPSPGKRRRP